MINKTDVKIEWQDSSEGAKEAQECDILEILVTVNSKVREDEPLAMIETAKATVEIVSTVSGVVTEIKLKVGDRAHYGDVLCVIEEK